MIIFGLLAGSTLMIGGVAFLSYRVVYQLLLSRLKEVTLLEVETNVNQIDIWLAERRAEIKTLAHSPTARGKNWQTLGPYLQSEINRIQEYEHLLYADTNGEYYTTLVGYAAGQNVSDRLWWQASIAGIDYVADPIISRTVGVVQVIIGSAIREEGESIGVIAGGIRIERLNTIVNQIRRGTDSYAFALNSEGRAIVHPNPELMGTVEALGPSFLEQADQPLAELAKVMVSGDQGVDLRYLDGRWHYVAYTSLQEAPWSIALVIPRENLESELQSLNILAAILGLLLGGALVGIWRQILLFEREQRQMNLVAQQSKQLKAALQKLQATQTQLIQSEKMSSLGQMVAGLAHEINNPVSFIHGNLNHADEYTQKIIQLMAAYEYTFSEIPQELQDFKDELDWDYLQADLPKVFASMRSGTERIRQLVLSLRNFSRLDEVDRKTVDLHDGLESTLLLLGHSVNDQITIIKNYGDLPPVDCYPSQINQVFMNLLSNAVDAVQGQPNPQIAIATRRIEDNEPAVVVQITDNGPGIPVEIKPKIFDPFFTTKAVGKGTGLGLAISYQIITEVHQGTIVQANNPEGGATFIVTLPLRSPPL